ncbi:ABC transporter substrate-binding protein [Paenibacillus ginsengarvi]|uniref:Extracellular solute-binding protein n=1 Tax=Paenibacillus ginsengarvi TaxID=400777 RepID=A0A3B0BCQ8_9BACL|nr:extracellular solute-binding protein [Paenibacillus ginsengarvi]RKN70144.1 extracellular solute-binding protein [Paenibacillus ginsengarvi]
MPKRHSLILMTAAGLLASAISGCSANNAPNAGNSDSAKTGAATAAAKKPEDFKGEITVWRGYKEVDELFMKKYPNVKINNTTPPDAEDKFVTALAAGTGAPDVVHLHEAHYWKVKATDGLENLLDAPYNAGLLQKDFLKAAWDMSLSLDGKRLYGLPFQLTPYVMFYRADIFEENGFPSDPAEVGKLVADPDKFFDMAQKLRSRGHYFFRKTTEVTDISSPNLGYFDKEMNFSRNTEAFAKAIDYAKRAAQLDLIYEKPKEETDRAVNNGGLVTYFGGTSRISSFLPGGTLSQNQGKWRVTTLPFGQVPGLVYGTFIIPSQSKNKEIAWEYIKFAAMSPEAQQVYMNYAEISPYLPNRNLPAVKDYGEPAIGGQKLLQLAFQIQDRIPYQSNIPLDAKAKEIWSKKLAEALTKNQDSRAVLKDIMDETEKAVAPDKEKLKRAIGK